MVDMHAHILYNVDDGPKTLAQTLQMLKIAATEGITHMIATPHSCHPSYNTPRSTIEQQVVELNLLLQQQHINITIYNGQEVRLVDDILKKLTANEVLTLANSQYLLLELPSDVVPVYTRHIISALLQQGIVPIIAHPERNKAIAREPKLLEELVRHGAMAQITAGSVVGHFGKSIQRFSLQLIKANLVHTYGSDAHNVTTRPFLFEKGLAYLEKQKQLEAVDMLLENNARILANKHFIVYEPQGK